MQPMCLFLGMSFEDASENPQWRKDKKCNQCNFNVNWFRYQNWCIIATRAPGDCMAKLTPLQGMRSMGFAIPPWERSWHGKTHTTWFLPWGMGFDMLHELSHVLPYMTLGKRWYMDQMPQLGMLCPLSVFDISANWHRPMSALCN